MMGKCALKLCLLAVLLTYMQNFVTNWIYIFNYEIILNYTKSCYSLSHVILDDALTDMIESSSFIWCRKVSYTARIYSLIWIHYGYLSSMWVLYNISVYSENPDLLYWFFTCFRYFLKAEHWNYRNHIEIRTSKCCSVPVEGPP